MTAPDPNQVVYGRQIKRLVSLKADMMLSGSLIHPADEQPARRDPDLRIYF